MPIRADFHIHSCLSPCAALEMAPAAIVRAARAAGLDAIALSDHNCAFNLPAFAAVCARENMPCLYGIEATSAEEAHMLCLFDDLEAALELGDRIYGSLPPVPNHPDRFGDQPVIDADENVCGFAEKFLVGASAYGIGELLGQVHALGGLFVPAHIDRPLFGVVAQLGFVPDEHFDAVELTAGGDPALARGFPVIRNSDSHLLAGLGSAWTDYGIGALSIANLRACLSEGRFTGWVAGRARR